MESDTPITGLSYISSESFIDKDGGHPERGGGSDLEFITFTNFKQIATQETKRRVRRHAQKKVQQTLRVARAHEKNTEIILDTSSLSQLSAGETIQDGSHPRSK